MGTFFHYLLPFSLIHFHFLISSKKHRFQTLYPYRQRIKNVLLKKKKKRRRRRIAFNRIDNWDLGSQLLPVFLTQFRLAEKTTKKNSEVNRCRSGGFLIKRTQSICCRRQQGREGKKTGEEGLRRGRMEESRGPINSWLRLDLPNGC